MHDVMIDLETMGTRPDAAIVAIGAVAFDPGTGQLGARLYLPGSLASSLAANGSMDADTVLWWMQQDEAARRELYRADREPLPATLADLAEWLTLHCGPADKLRVWGNGAGFDNVLLRGAYQRCGQVVPWMHWNDRCYRTLKALHPGVPLARTGTHHNAVDDAESQARHALAILGRPAP